MKIAITDASIFIDLYELGGLGWLKTLGFEVHTTDLVLNELSGVQLAVVELVVDVIQKITFEDMATLQNLDLPKGLSTTDHSLIWYHERLGERVVILFSSDNLIRKWASKKSIEVHGIFWIFDQMVDASYLRHDEACTLLEKLMRVNAWLPQSEGKKRLEAWGAWRP
jgi:hypothetical protein